MAPCHGKDGKGIPIKCPRCGVTHMIFDDQQLSLCP